MNKYKISTLLIAVLIVTSTSCFNDLDTEPLNKQITTSNSAFSNPASYKEFLAKLYGSLTLTGQRGEFGQPEISAPDEGTTSFLRMYWSLQEIPTDECITAWGDPGLIEFRGHNWSEQNPYIQLLYQRVFINIAYCNEFIREVSPRINSLPADLQDEATLFVAEARFLRAFNYYVALDLWGNVPFVTEKDDVGAFLPPQINRADLFDYLEKELTEIVPLMAPAGQNEYARADQAAAHMLLAKLYLNAKVYLGEEATPRYTESISQLNSILTSGAYSLTPDYTHLFLADNHLQRNEIILPIAEDGNNTRNYGGVTFIIHAQVGGTMDPDNGFGIASGGWFGNRFTSTFANQFDDITGTTDSRALFYTSGQTLDITNPVEFSQGYLGTKFKNITSTGVKGQNETFVDTDFPLFRLADVYLMYAEAVLRGGNGGDMNTALNYVNDLRERAYGDASGNITLSELNLPFILSERSRELYWEAHRRTDLIRFGQFAGDSYVWEWKGNVKPGTSTPVYVTLFPIPASDRAVNPNLDQNVGY